MAEDRRAACRVVALDIDGTLLDSRQRVTPELKCALAALAARGVHTVLCTGRRWQSAHPVLMELEHAHPIVICCGGSLIKDADGERTLRAMPLQDVAARLIADSFRQHGLVPFLLFDRPLGGKELMVAGADRARAEALPYVLANPNACTWHSGDYPDGDERPLMIYTVDTAGTVCAAEQAVRREVGPRGIIEMMRQPRYGTDQVALEVHDPAATKWTALQWLLGEWGVDAAEVIAMGDDVNDIPMLRGAGLSFAMANANDVVKAAADRLTASNDEHGVVAALKTVFDLD